MDGYKNWFDTTMVMDKISKKTQEEIQQAIQNGKFEEDYLDYVDQLNEKQSKIYSYLVVYDRDKFTYIGIPDSMSSNILVGLPSYPKKTNCGTTVFCPEIRRNIWSIRITLHIKMERGELSTC